MIAKIFDKLINDQLIEHLLTHNIISPTQYAFRPNSSTTTALQTVINNIHKHIHKHKPTLAIYIDLSKAYDTISHKKLLHKLKYEFNFTDNTLQLFKTYFKNRQQSVHTTEAQSETQTITHGTPQGSTLSATIFLLYINNIIKTITHTNNSKVYTYADDTTLIITADTQQALQQIAQTELTQLIKYFHLNDLVPNPTKTQYTIFHPKNTHDTTTLHINNTPIEHTTQAKLLGAMIQDHMKHHQTTMNIIKKLQPIITRFKNANKLVTTQTMKQLYYTHAYPHLIGAITIWGTNKPNAEYIQPLIRTQKKLIRLIMNLPPQTHTQPLMKKLKILNIINLYTLRTAMELHPHIHPKEHKNRPEHDHYYTQTNQIHEHKTRQSKQNKYYIPNQNLLRQAKVTQRTPLYTAGHLNIIYLTIWNELPQRIRDNTNKDNFKTELTEHLLLKQDTT